jgi:hypothetical protein
MPDLLHKSTGRVAPSVRQAFLPDGRLNGTGREEERVLSLRLFISMFSPDSGQAGMPDLLSSTASLANQQPGRLSPDSAQYIA